MRLLELNFIAKQFRFTQRERNKNFAIYLKENNVPVESPLYYFCYEVIRIRKREAESFKRFGKLIELPLRELYPTDNTWGLYGWTFEDLKTAEVYFIKLCEKVDSTADRKVNNRNLSQYRLPIFKAV